MAPPSWGTRVEAGLRTAWRTLPRDRRAQALARLRRLRDPAWRGARNARPVSAEWGWDRGGPVDRFYIDEFLAEGRADISGRVLEVRDRRYTQRWGTDVEVSHVVDLDPATPDVTWVADLADGAGLPSDAYDCFVLTQTLHFIYDIAAAVRTAHRVLAPGGVLLATAPVTSRISQVDEGTEIDCWRLTPASCRRLFGDVFGAEAVTVEGRGNLPATVAFLRGMAWQELPRAALRERDPLYPLVVSVRARKAAG
jgi:SAM-dependent methyltransferase